MHTREKEIIMKNVKNLKDSVLVNNICCHAIGKRDKNFLITQQILKKFEEIEIMLKEQDTK